MVIVEASVGAARQTHDLLAHRIGQATVAGPTAAGVCQSGCAAVPITGFEAFDTAEVSDRAAQPLWHTPDLPSHTMR